MTKSGPPRLIPLCSELGRFLRAKLVAEWTQLELGYRRAALLAVYRQRQQWKKADVGPLLRLGVSDAAQLRMARILSKGGRGVVRPFVPLPVACARIGRLFAGIFDPGTPRDERQQLLRWTPWWPALIEAAYRGELSAAQHAAQGRGKLEHGHEEPSEVAQRRVAKAARLSVQQVQRLCRQARVSYERGETASPPIRAAVLRKFIASGVREP